MQQHRQRYGRIAWLALATAMACATPPPPAPKADLDALPSDLMGRVGRYRTVSEDTLVDLAVQHDVGYVEIMAANPGVDPWLPGEGTDIILPTAHLYPAAPRVGIVVNVLEQRLYYYPAKGGAPITFPIGIGRDGWETPLGVTKVLRKKKNPVWYPGPGARGDDPTLKAAVPPGDENPLGAHAFYLSLPGYLIHGTNMPYGIGRRSSRGCVRLYPDDMAKLFEIVPIGTPVRLVSEPFKLGWFRGDLYLEAHLSLRQATELEDTGKFTPEEPPDVQEQIRKAAGAKGDKIDWDIVRKTLLERRGVPTRITAHPGAEPELSRSFTQRLADLLLGGPKRP